MGCRSQRSRSRLPPRVGQLQRRERRPDVPGYDCTTETHAVTAFMNDVTSTDAPGRTGTAVLMATLTHYHTWVLGTCYTYSARVDGSITAII